MAYVRVDGKWVHRSSLRPDEATSEIQTENRLTITSSASAAVTLESEPKTAMSGARTPQHDRAPQVARTLDVATAAQSSAKYDAMKGAQWIIDDFLCVGNFSSAGVTGTTKAKEAKRLELLRHGITHIANCTREFDCPFRTDFEYLHLFATDDTHQNMIAFWPASCDFIEEARVLGGRVLIHCAGGHSRSGSTAVAYLMKHKKLKMEEALAEAQTRRPSVMPNPGFREQLQLFYRMGYAAPTEGEFSVGGNLHRLHCLKAGNVPVRTCSVETGEVSPVRLTTEACTFDRRDVLNSTSIVDDSANQSIYIQFCSDMHLELPLETKRFGLHLRECLQMHDPKAFGSSVGEELEATNVIPAVQRGAYLALLGDIFDGAKIRDGTYRNYLMRQSPSFKGVFIVAGNHEFYRAEYHKTRAALAALCLEVTAALGGAPVVHFLDCSSVDIPNTQIRILGCTLWSSVSDESSKAVGEALNDYSAISVACGPDEKSRNAVVADTNAWHVRELGWLEHEIIQAQCDGKRCIVMTHHAPSFHGTCKPAHSNSTISSGFCTSLERLLRPPVSAWLFGHTHWSSWQRYRPDGTEEGGQWFGVPEVFGSTDPVSVDNEAGDVLVASNQTGYGAMGEHTQSRGHPFMALVLSPDGGQAALQCTVNSPPRREC